MDKLGTKINWVIHVDSNYRLRVCTQVMMGQLVVCKQL